MHASSSEETGLWALQALLRLRNIDSTVEELRNHVGHGAVGIAEIRRCARAYGFTTRSRATSWQRLAAIPLPGIVALRDGRFLLLGNVDHEQAVVLALTT